jgi:hypothetical protein
MRCPAAVMASAQGRGAAISGLASLVRAALRSSLAQTVRSVCRGVAVANSVYACVPAFSATLRSRITYIRLRSD